MPHWLSQRLSLIANKGVRLDLVGSQYPDLFQTILSVREKIMTKVIFMCDTGAR